MFDKKAYDKEYREKNREKKKAYDTKYYEENKEKIKACKKKYREENKEKLEAYKKKYDEENREKKKAYDKKYHEENRDKLLDQKTRRNFKGTFNTPEKEIPKELVDIYVMTAKNDRFIKNQRR